jgi:transcriptional regulator with XRE-family HTH domain
MQMIDGIGFRIQEARKALGLTQEEFARRLKISRVYLCKIEQQMRPANERILHLVALTFGVNSRWLETGAGKMFDIPKDHKLDEIVENFKKLDDLLQDYVLKQIRLAREYQEEKKTQNR